MLESSHWSNFLSIWAPSPPNLNPSPSLSTCIIMDQFHNSNPPAQHAQSYTLGQLPDTTFDFTLYLQIQYDTPDDSTAPTFNQAGPSNAGLNNSLYSANSNNCSQSSLSLYNPDPVDFESAWVGIFNCTSQGLWETPGYGTSQTARGYLESLPGDTADTFSDFIIHQSKLIPPLAIQPLSNYSTQLLQTTGCMTHHMLQADHQRASQVIC